MPIVTLIAENMPVLLPMQGRSSGVHISTIINDLCIRLGHYDPKEDFNQSQLEIGNAFEWAIIERMSLNNPGRYIRPGELTVDGRHGTPDLFDMNVEAVDEFKCTWMSVKNGPGSKKFWKYETQIKAYCHMVGWLVSHLHVLHLNGDYSFGRMSGPPMYRCYRYVFTQSELTANWSMLMAHANTLENK